MWSLDFEFLSSSLKYLLDVDVCAVVEEPRACPPGETKQKHRPKACRTQPAVDTVTQLVGNTACKALLDTLRAVV